MDIYIPKVSDRIHVNTYFHNGAGTVVFVDNASLFEKHCFPIQVELDEPYDDSEQKMIRINLKEIVGAY
jgi:hypothetical protein